MNILFSLCFAYDCLDCRDREQGRIFVVATGKRVVVVHVFIKKTAKTPPKAIKIAMERAKEAGLL